MTYTAAFLAKVLGFPPNSRVVGMSREHDVFTFEVEHEAMPDLDEAGEVQHAGIIFEMRTAKVDDRVVYTGFGVIKDKKLQWTLGFSDDLNEKARKANGS